MKDKDAQLILEAYIEAHPQSAGAEERRISDDDIQAKVAEVVKKYLSLDDNHPMSGDTTYISSVLVDIQGLIDGTGDEDIRRHYEGWSNADLVEFTRALRYKMEEYLNHDDLMSLGDPDEARRYRKSTAAQQYAAFRKDYPGGPVHPNYGGPPIR